MSAINIATFDIPNWQLGGASCTLRIFADQTFRNSDGDVILRGSAKGPWYQEIACTISGTTITVPQFTIDSTTDASNRNATYTGILFDSNDVRRDAFFSAYKIPHNFGSTVGWSAIHAYNSSIKSILPYAYPNTDQVASIVSGLTTSMVTLTGAQTLTNKRIDPRVGTTATSATPTPVGDSNDLYAVTALAAAAELQAPSGTPVNGQGILIRIKDDGTPRALTYNAIYRAIGVTLPTTTAASKTIYLGCVYNSADSKWDVVGVAEEL